MQFTEVRGVEIRAIAAAVPNQWFSIDRYAPIFGEGKIASFKKSSGVEGRYLTIPGQTTSDLCFAAAEKVIAEKSIDKAQIGALVVVTQTGDYGLPSTAYLLQHRLGLSADCLAFDINLGCSGYAYGLNILANLMQNSNMRYGLLLVGDTLGSDLEERDLPEEEVSSTLLLGDAGTATLLEKAEKLREKLTFGAETWGGGYSSVRNCYGGYRHITQRKRVYMDDIEVFNFILSTVPQAMRDYFSYCGTTPDDYDCFALHQASFFTIKQLTKKLKIGMERVPLSLPTYGNTSCATIPVTLVDAFGNCEDNHVIRTMMCGFGVGLSISAASVSIHTADILPMIHTDEKFMDAILEKGGLP